MWRDRVPAAVALAVLPGVLVVGFYLRPWLVDGVPPRAQGDGRAYVYQLRRVADLGGRWWRIADDEPIGRPYPTGAAKLPQFYEGLDLLLASTITSRFLSPDANYFALVGIVLVVNGWVAAWLTWRWTRSVLWSALAVILITLNAPTAARMNAHLQLFKHGWFLLAFWCFSQYLEAPSVARGVKLGLAAVLVLQGSFYAAYLMGLGFGIWWLGAALARRVGRAHLPATLAAGATAVALGLVVTFPLWRPGRPNLLAYLFVHPRAETWYYGSQLWQYVISPSWHVAADFLADSRVTHGGFEGWNYPGVVPLLGTVAYVVWRLRGGAPSSERERFLARAYGLIAIFVVLSLAGGASAFLVQLVPNFRAFGRAGLMAVALWSVATPILLQQVGRSVFPRGLRVAAAAAAIALALADGRASARQFTTLDGPGRPAWVEWLAHEPARVRCAVLPDLMDRDHDSLWHWNHVYFWTIHGHETLSGAEIALFNRDLGLVGATYYSMTEAGLRFVLSLGYDTFIFDRGYLARNPSIRTIGWLEPGPVLDGWEVYRAMPEAPRFQVTTLADLLATYAPTTALARVPRGDWITDGFALPEATVTTSRDHVELVWVDERGREVRRPRPALIQHYFSASVPAYTIQTPATPGRYRLRFVGDGGLVLAERPYTVADMKRAAAHAPEVAAGLVGATLPRVTAGDGVDLRLENRSGFYVQMHPQRAEALGWERLQPSMGETSPRGVRLLARYHEADGVPREVPILLPRDVLPHETLAMQLGETALGTTGGPVEVVPEVVGVRAPPGRPTLVIAGPSELDR